MRTATPVRGFAFLLLAAFMSLAGCQCGAKKIAKAKGEPQFAEPTPKDPHLTIKDAGKTLEIDFGYTLVNQDKPNARTVTIKNDGVGAFTILKLVKEDGFNSDVFKTPNQNEINKTVPAGGSATFTVAFAPTDAKDYTNKFTLQTDVDEVGTGSDGTLTVVLKGTGVNNGCVLAPSDSLDFGNVKNGTSYQKKLVVQNTTPLDWTFTFQGVTGTDKDEFSTDLAVGDTVIKSNDSLTITVTFIANHPGSSSANLQFASSADMCAPVPFALHGNGVDSLITATPSPVDFGFVDPGADWGSVKQVVTLTNIGNDPINIVGADQGLICDGQWTTSTTSPACSATSEFADNSDGTITAPGDFSMTLTPGEPQTMTLYFKPARLHTAKGHVQVGLVDSAIQPYFGFDLTGVGGGPKIQVQPAAIDYGTVAIGAPQNRNVVITNIGSSPSGQTQADLIVSNLDITPDQGTVSTEFTVDQARTAELPKHLTAGKGWPVAIKFDPTGDGQRGATLHVKSNDPTKPDVAVHLTAEGKQLPPCTYSVTPPSLNFGNVQPGRNRILSFRIKNENTTGDCLISALDIGADTTNPPFSLVDGPVASKTLAAQDIWDVDVKFAPTQSGGNYQGSISFYTSSQAAPQGTVALSGGSSPGCLLITPDDLDFGTVQVGCASRERTFTIYNVCNSAVSITSIGLMPDSTNRCPDQGSTHTCPFRITHMPSAMNVPVGGSVDFKMKFQPGQPETDVASVAVQTASLTEPYVVTLHGVGDTTAIQTDVFRQDAQPKVDVLLVVDDSGSMSDKQQALASNFQSFIQFAVSQQVDYHIGVTSTSTSAGGTTCPTTLPSSSTSFDSVAPCGLLTPIDGSRLRVLTNTSPDLEQVFSQNVNLGTNGSSEEMGFEGAYEALTSPDLTGWNSGFLRDEANLAVVAVSDASDQSPNTFDFYKNFFLNIKGFRRTNAFTFSAVSSTGATPPAGAGSCSYDGTNAVPNPYQLMAQQTNGVFQEICTTDWATSLRQLGQSAFGYRTRFFLSETPDTTYAIQVQLDGVDYPATTSRGTVQWTYNSSAGAIDFQPLAVPEPGSTLTISYHVLCYPTTP